MAKEKPVEVPIGEDLPLGSRIRLRRQQSDVRLSAMARDLGYDRGYLSKVENNVVSPSDELLEKIAKYLEISVADLKEAPIEKLASKHLQRKSARRAGFVYGAPPLPKRNRAIGDRIERLIKMAHLSEDEEKVFEERLVAIVSELLKLIKDARQIG